VNSQEQIRHHDQAVRHAFRGDLRGAGDEGHDQVWCRQQRGAGIEQQRLGDRQTGPVQCRQQGVVGGDPFGLPVVNSLLAQHHPPPYGSTGA